MTDDDDITLSKLSDEEFFKLGEEFSDLIDQVCAGASEENRDWVCQTLEFKYGWGLAIDYVRKGRIKIARRNGKGWYRFWEVPEQLH
jgi:hypothetical protein